MDKKQITILVAGDHNSAKTTTIAVIEKALRDAGLSPKLLSVAASEAKDFVGEKHLAWLAEEIKDKVEISIEELTMPAPLLEGNVVPKGYMAIRHAGGMKIIPRGISPAE